MKKSSELAGSNFVTGTIEGIFTDSCDGKASAARSQSEAASADGPGSAAAATMSKAPAAVGGDRAVSRVRINGVEYEVDVVVVALGPWSNLAAAWLPLPMAVSGQKYHSAVLAPKDPV